ncbi:MAG: Gfo/Idh/MocA family oxidoreductase [Armatimonas sp.]
MSTYSPLRWGILGAGSIAHQFTGDVQPLLDQEVVAVGSREIEKANAFADKYNIANRHDSYEALVADPSVDAIYVATPHNFHKEHVLLSLRAGKHVLCEKPFTVNAKEAEEIIVEARGRKLFLMEAMWPRFFPGWAKVRELIASGAIGKVRMLEADFGFKGGSTGDDGMLTGVNPEARLYNPALAGGALMDVGCYPVSLAQMILGTPVEVAALGTIGHTGVDENTAMLLRYAGGEIAITSTSLQVNTGHNVTIVGTDGRIEVRSNWWCPKQIVLIPSNQVPQPFEFPFEGKGFQFEAMEVAACLRAGKTESEILSLDDSLVIMKSLDALRDKLGLKYPME